MEPLSDDEIANGFINLSRRAAKAVQIPDLSAVDWGGLDFFSWRHPRTPDRAYLAIRYDGKPVAVELRAAAGRAASRTSMCEFCHTVHSMGSVRLFSAAKAGTAGRRGDTLGHYLCADLACSAYVRGRKRPIRVQPATTATPEERAEQVVRAVQGFVHRITDGATA